ncbi:YheC/YheD family protein [Paenibacillus antarcticus]|uniref:ATP-grasp domain-containing protein n=1 Tax=Paenibacillus antarcticus TaxID=253703 RepID=A0A168QS73_9BACL|nr:YheC/YheD family protein [Paenibacillus antarcticus]OAB48136.1 hypothetical protein PBAT_00390 [Paenibacillus antarcticus]
MQQLVGILLNASMHRGIPRCITGQESLANYEEGAQVYGLIPVFLKLEDIDLETGRCVAYIKNDADYVLIDIPIPKVIHNRAIYINNSSHLRISRLLNRGIIVFNVCNRYGKDEIHRRLSSNPSLNPFLPNTDTATPIAIRRMMKQHHDLILKPCRGSIGQGIMRLRKVNTKWMLTYSNTPSIGEWKTITLNKEQLPPIVLRRISLQPFLVQERIPLAEYQGNAYDIRVTIQRGLQGLWQMTGMYAKIAPSNTFVTNIAQGATAVPVESILTTSIPSQSPLSVIQSIEQVTLEIAWSLSTQLPWLADFGMDIGITSEGKPYFIECNGRDQRYGFRKASMISTWRKTYEHPMAYAHHLLESDVYRRNLPHSYHYN